jgi:hypothetical protein
MNRAIAAFVLALVALPCAAADPTWQFLRVRRDLNGATSYVPTTATAMVSIDAIRATATLMHTDARPYTVTGRMHSWSREENWAGELKIVTSHEITFPFDPNFEPYAFLSKDARDK